MCLIIKSGVENTLIRLQVYQFSAWRYKGGNGEGEGVEGEKYLYLVLRKGLGR